MLKAEIEKRKAEMDQKPSSPRLLPDFAALRLGVKLLRGRCRGRRLRESRQKQTVGSEWLEIGHVNGRQLRAATNRHRRNHAIGQRAGTASSLVEQSGGQNRVGFAENFRDGKNRTRQRFARRVQWTA